MAGENRKVALVLGASGGVGGEVAAKLVQRGWRVTALARNPEAARSAWPKMRAGPDWTRGDAMDGASVAAAAQGAWLIVHGVNPPGYRDWARLVPAMLENTIAAAEANGARIVLPGTVYNFGPDSFDRPDEAARQAPATRKGAIRVRMEQRLKAVADGGTPALIVRAGDFFGPRAGGSWFSQGLVRPGRPVRAISYPGRRGVGHQWAYLPDVAETIVRLVERSDELAPFETFHMEGVWDADGERMIAAIRQAVGRPDLTIKAFPWGVTRLAAPFVTTLREMQEMRYLWNVPLHMRNDRLVAFLGEEPHTPLDVAVRDTLAALGCIQP